MKLCYISILYFILFVSFSERMIYTNRDDFKSNLNDSVLVELKCFLEYERFKYNLGAGESQNKWDTTNTLGYIGTWQFGRAALITTGFEHVTYDEFIKNPYIFSFTDQNIAMDSLISFNSHILRKTIAYFERKVVVIEINGNKHHITKSGLIAGAHLAGAGGVINFIYEGIDAKDDYETKVSDYLVKYSGYNF